MNERLEEDLISYDEMLAEEYGESSSGNEGVVPNNVVPKKKRKGYRKSSRRGKL